jgi:hypothetical protein
MLSPIKNETATHEKYKKWLMAAEIAEVRRDRSSNKDNRLALVLKETAYSAYLCALCGH